MIRWSYESVAETCRAVDAERLAAGNMRPLVQQDFRENPHLPSYNTADRYLGGQDGIARVLGRVTTGIAREWSDETWAENAHFIQDVHEKADKKLLTKPDIARYASAGLMPHEGVIIGRWNSIPEYRIAMGIVDIDIRAQAANWTKDDSIANGKKFSAWLGRDYGLEIMPVQDDVLIGIKNSQLQKMSQIKKLHGDIFGFQADLGFVNSRVVDGWSDSQWQDNFEWLRDVFTKHDLPFTNLQDILIIAGKLRIGPSTRKTYEKWGSILNYARHVGFESFRQKCELSNEAGVRAGIELVLINKKPLTRDDLGGDLTRDLVRHRYGSLNKFNQKLGMAHDFRGWSEQELMWWSITWHKPTSGQLPSKESLKTWHSQGRGPSLSKIKNAFGSIEEFERQLIHASMWFETQVKCLSATLKMPPELFRSAITRDSSLFKMGENLEISEFELYTQLKNRGVDLHGIVMLQKNGISFENPEPQLNWLARLLDQGKMLNSATLKRLMPYVVGLAPPHPNMSWAEYIKEFRQQNFAVEQSRAS